MFVKFVKALKAKEGAGFITHEDQEILNLAFFIEAYDVEYVYLKVSCYTEDNITFWINRVEGLEITELDYNEAVSKALQEARSLEVQARKERISLLESL